MSFFRQLIDLLLAPLRLLFAPQKWGSALRRMGQMSLPTGAATIMALFLFTFLIAFIVAMSLTGWINGTGFPWWQQISLIILLMIVIPIVTYFCVKLWLEGELSAFDDIDQAWRAGLAELARNGLDPRRIPIFLVIGSEGNVSEVNLFAASGLNMTLDDFPSGPSALHWYANRDAIYIVCSDVGSMSHLATLAAEQQEAPRASSSLVPRGGGANIRETVWPTMEQEFQPEALMARSAAQPPGGSGGGGGDDIRGTMFVPQEENLASSSSKHKKKLVLDRQDVDRQRRRLEYLCRLIRRYRRPLCPLNGVLALVPLNMLLADDDEAAASQEAVRSDADITLKTLKLRCPVTVLVTGWEYENGFHELIRRIQPLRKESVRTERFGKGFDVWTLPTPDGLEALCQNACWGFEHWVYFLFKDKAALQKPGNRLLYGLLCRVRLYLERRLDRTLVSGFARDETATGYYEPLLFAGCYFAATGATDEHQAFVRSIFQKLLELEEKNELDWTSAALAEDNRCRYLAWTGYLLAGGLLAVEVAMLLGYLGR